MTAPPATAIEMIVPLEDAFVAGELALPEQAAGIVVFAHGSGSGRHSPRNQLVAERLNQAGLGTVLLDLLTAEEDEIDRITGEFRFDITLLSGRVTAAVDWLRAGPASSLDVGLFGASTGAAAALVAAALRPADVSAVVSRGGRPDLAGPALPHVKAPTLLIVGADDDRFVLEVNQQALELLRTEKRLVVVAGAGHLFEEPGALEEVARLAIQWFLDHLADGTD
jgi:putative phosphoribosyl transferase